MEGYPPECEHLFSHLSVPQEKTPLEVLSCAPSLLFYIFCDLMVKFGNKIEWNEKSCRAPSVY